MAKWKPITEDELAELIRQQFTECEPDQRATFEQYRVALRRAPIMRYGKHEKVFVVAQRGNEVLYFEDVEDGFNFSPVDADGRILEHWCDQDELRHALWHWMGRRKSSRLGPAEPTTEE